jgi:hypothetical protein
MVQQNNDYDSRVCNLRHESIEKWIEQMDKRISKTENRFLVLITALTLNLVGVAAGLLLLIVRLQHSG